MPYPHDALVGRWQRCDMVGRVLPPKKARVTVQVKEGAHRAVTRNDKKSFPGHVVATAVTRWSFPVFPLSPLKRIV